MRKDPFSRTYSMEFMDFHPKINLALQSYARTNPGNSFQITRLGNDAVIIRGLYQREKVRVPVTLTIKPGGASKSLIEIKISWKNPDIAPEDLEVIASELFQIVEKATALRPSQ
ncbi:MAG: hypothetical protein HY882_14350 [Deltaproteobacteria bacterium]|nr:hypothetical protein [Deltaproteobacteria bacterium]